MATGSRKRAVAVAALALSFGTVVAVGEVWGPYGKGSPAPTPSTAPAPSTPNPQGKPAGNGNAETSVVRLVRGSDVPGRERGDLSVQIETRPAKGGGGNWHTCLRLRGWSLFKDDISQWPEDPQLGIPCRDDLPAGVPLLVREVRS